MPRDAKGKARSKRECDVETLAARILHKLLWQSRGVRKNDKQVAKQHLKVQGDSHETTATSMKP